MDNVRITYNKMAYLLDNTLSLKAKGVMATMIAYINTNSVNVRNFSTMQVKSLCSDGTVSFNNAIKELENHGYFIRSTQYGVKGSPWTYELKE